MNIFVLDRNPANAVCYLADCHVRKMCLEHAQILSTLVFMRNPRELPRIQVELQGPGPYNIKHPVITAVDTEAKLKYVLRYNIELHKEYIFRFGNFHTYFKLHRYYLQALLRSATTPSSYSSECSPEGLHRCFGSFVSPEQDLVYAYRDYYRYKKSIIRNWKYTNRQEPAWLQIGDTTDARPT